MANGKRLKQNGVNEGEDSGVRTDAQRQCDYGDGSKALPFQKAPESVTKIF
jgi:hypothetical protein